MDWSLMRGGLLIGLALTSTTAALAAVDYSPHLKTNYPDQVSFVDTHPTLSPNNAFADCYCWDWGNFGIAANTSAMLPREYARAAPTRGLAYEAKLGANPFKLGIIGSADSSTGPAITAEENFFSKATPLEPGAGDARCKEPIIQKFPGAPGVSIYGYESVASGLVGVWARANTREEIFDAMARREVSAITGIRMRVRMFGGWNFSAANLHDPHLSGIGYGNVQNRKACAGRGARSARTGLWFTDLV
jgi:Protein of unknown function (DUF3604)